MESWETLRSLTVTSMSHRCYKCILFIETGVSDGCRMYRISFISAVIQEVLTAPVKHLIPYCLTHLSRLCLSQPAPTCTTYTCVVTLVHACLCGLETACLHTYTHSRACVSESDRLRLLLRRHNEEAVFHYYVSVSCHRS